MPEAAAAAPEAAAPQRAKPAKPQAKLTSAQRAAAVIIALGAEKASKLYQHMEPEEVEQLTLEVAKLGFLDSEQTEEALSDYYRMCSRDRFSAPERTKTPRKNREAMEEMERLIEERASRRDE